MNPIEQLNAELTESIANVKTKLRRPRRPEGTWWLDASLDDHTVAVEWSPRRGFGITASMLTDGYGEGPDEVVDKPERALRRVGELLQDREHTRPPTPVLLHEIRALTGMTQQELAERLGVQQAAVSRLERRDEITVRSLRRYVEALGGVLEIHFRGPSGDKMPLFGTSAAAEQGAQEPVKPYRAREASPHAQGTAADAQASKVCEATGTTGYTTRSASKGKRPASARLGLLVLRCANLDKSRAFYSALGFALTAEKHGKGPRHSSFRLNDTLVELYPVSARNGPSHVRLGVALPDLATALERLREARLLPRAPKPVHDPSGAERYLVRDPDGNVLELESVA